MTSAGNGSNNVKNAVGRINRIGVLTIDAYGVAVKNGYKGTVEEWLESLKAFSPKVEVFGLIEDFVNEDGDSERREGFKISVTDENGKSIAKVWNGKDGINGVDAVGSIFYCPYTPNVSVGTLHSFGFETIDLQGRTPKVGDFILTADSCMYIITAVVDSCCYTTCMLKLRGTDGNDGVSPTVETFGIFEEFVTESGSTERREGAKIVITDKNGTKEVKVWNGEKGDKGVSPTVETFGIFEDYVTESGSTERREGAKIVITDENGTKEVKVWNGEKGEQGGKGETGNSGVYVGSEPPEDETIGVWVDTSEEANFYFDDVHSGIRVIDSGLTYSRGVVEVRKIGEILWLLDSGVYSFTDAFAKTKNRTVLEFDLPKSLSGKIPNVNGVYGTTGTVAYFPALAYENVTYTTFNCQSYLKRSAIGEDKDTFQLVYTGVDAISGGGLCGFHLKMPIFLI